MKTYLNPEFALEAQEDHIARIKQLFVWLQIAYQTYRRDCVADMEAIVLKSERFYPNHPTTLKMRADFDELNK